MKTIYIRGIGKWGEFKFIKHQFIKYIIMFKRALLLFFLLTCTFFVKAQSAKKFYSSGSKFLESLSYEDAINSYTKAIELDPKYVKAYQARAYCYEKTGRNSDAADDYRRATVFAPKDKENYFNAGRLYYDLGKYTEADAMLRDAIVKDKEYNEAIEVFLKVLLKLKNFKDGLEASQLWIDNKRTAPAYYYHAVMLDSLKNYTEAEKEYKNSKYYDSKFIPAYVGLILVQDKLKKYDEALSIADAAISKDPTNKDIFYARSCIFASKNDFGTAVNDISKVIVSDQNNEMLFMKRGEYYEKLGQYQNAIYDFSKVIGMNGKDLLQAYYKRAWNYEQLTNFKSAAVDYEKIMTLAPNNEKAKEMMKAAIEKLFELNRESYKPEIELLTPKANERNVVKLPGDKTEIVVRGTVKDASKIKAISINNVPANFTKDTINPDFGGGIQIGTGTEFSISATDIYDNTKKIIYTIDRTEINKPVVELVSPMASSDNEIFMDNTNPELYIEGKVKDESLIESIIVEGVSASYALESLNPTFSIKANIANKNDINIRVRDINGNETNVKYKLNREGALIAKDNPMGITWVVFVENTNYKNFPILEGPGKDVTMMKSALANYKVNKIIHKKDLTKDGLEKFFSIELRDQLRLNNVTSVVIWYAGHGKFVNQTGYWIPVDAKVDDEFTYFSINNLKGSLQGYDKLAHLLVVTDACESGPSFMLAMRATPKERRCDDWESTKLKSSQVLSSAGFELAADNSQFTKTFAASLNNNPDGCISIDKISEKVAAAVQKTANQAPKLRKIKDLEDEDGTFFFMKK